MGALPEQDEKGVREKSAEAYLAQYCSVRNILSQILPILLVTLTGSLIAGLLLSGMINTLTALPGLLIMIPAVMDTRGSIYASLGSRIGSGLHLGFVEPSFRKNPHLLNAILGSLINALIISTFIAILAFGFLTYLGLPVIPIYSLIAIAIIAGILSGTILTIVVLVASIAGYNRGIDPDNLSGPVVSVFGDMISILMLLLTAQFVLGVL
ncbi:MAG: magnesium transporter [Thaumarchaeota archaeon]|nr:magnesium transporter [Nitrososphaerota archaeon]